MSLRKECIDMFELIFKGLPNYEDRCIEEDTGVFLCPDNNYIDIEMLSCDCYEKCPMRDSCNKEYVKVDLSIFVPWWAGDEDGGTIYINFNKRPLKEQYRNTVHYINDRKKLIDFMYELKQRTDSVKNEYAKYAQKVIELRKYGEMFLLQVQNDFPVFSNIKNDLPIVFPDFDKDSEGRYKYDTNGKFYVDDIQLIIHIYDCWRDIEELKITVRHEIIHYILFRIGVNNSDTSGVFHYLCNKYDAHAYKEMPRDEQEVYNSLMKQSPMDISDMLKKIGRKIVMGYAE